MPDTDNPTGRVCYFNGKIVPESEAVVSFRDRGFKYGDAVFDTTRTFGHRIFRLDEHVDRLFKSLRYLQIDPRPQQRGVQVAHHGGAGDKPGAH